MTRCQVISVSLHSVDEDYSMETMPGAPASSQQVVELCLTFERAKKLDERVEVSVLLLA